MSKFLVPQYSTDDIIRDLMEIKWIRENIPSIRKSYDHYPSESEFADLREVLKMNDEKHDPDVVNRRFIDTKACLNCDNRYSWEQRGEVISITYFSSVIGHDDITIDKHDIKSPFLSGTWFDDALEHKIKIYNGKISITFRTEASWPVLMCGGIMDLNSLYSLAYYAKKYDLHYLYCKILGFCACRVHSTSCCLLSCILMDSDELASMYFGLLAYSKTGDSDPLLRSLYIISTIDKQAFKYIENALCLLAKSGVGLSFFRLASLHLDVSASYCSDFIPNGELAIEYLRHAAAKYGDPNAIEILGMCYIHGLYIPEDAKTGNELLALAGKVPDSSVVTDVTRKRSPTRSLLRDSLILTGVGALGIGLVFFAVRRVSRLLSR